MKRKEKNEIFLIKCPDCGSTSGWTKNFALHRKYREFQVKEREKNKKLKLFEIEKYTRI